MYTPFNELKDATEKLELQYEILIGDEAVSIIEASFIKFQPFRREGHLGIGGNSIKLKLSDHEWTFSEALDDEPVYVFFEQSRTKANTVFKLLSGRYFCKVLEECSGMEYFMTNSTIDYLIAVNWYTIEIVDNKNFEKLK